MALKKWIVGHPDRDFALKASEELDIDPFSALLMCTRGINEIDEMEYFITDEPILSDPRELCDIIKAADCINDAIDSGLKIAVYGDYDCDGVVSTAIMYKFLKSRNADVITYIPDRISEGYGMNRNAIDKLKGLGVEFIITVDNGVASLEEISYAASLGIVTVVTDHHLPQETLPDAAAVVDPHRNDDLSEFKDICGAFVAFKVVCVALDKEPEELIDEYSDLVAVATIGDVMPLLNENRSIVKQGIKRLRQNSNLGLSTLFSVAGIDRNSVDASKVSFGIVPRLNAAGRMGNADRALDLIICDKINTALSLANEIENENSLRQKTEKEIVESVLQEILQNGYDRNRVIVVSGNDYHLGVVGIVAARISERFGRPAIVLSSDGEMSHGSGRSIKGFNLFEAIKSCSGILERFGGHELAAGVSLKTEMINEFRNAINKYALYSPLVFPSVNIDFKINPKGLSIDMAEAIKLLEPYGNANPLPVFGIFGVELSNITPIGHGKHLRLTFSKENCSFKALLFGVTFENFCFDVGDILDLAVNLDINTYKNVESLSVIIKAIRPYDIDDDTVFKEHFALDDYLSFGKKSDILFLPDRSKIGMIYRFISENSPKKDKVIYRFIKSLGIFTSEISIIILKELGLVYEESGYLKVDVNKPKCDLNNSEIYCGLK